MINLLQEKRKAHAQIAQLIPIWWDLGLMKINDKSLNNVENPNSYFFHP